MLSKDEIVKKMAELAGLTRCGNWYEEIEELVRDAAMIEKSESKEIEVPCIHKQTYSMRWPDNGESQICVKCLRTIHHDLFSDSGWQDHGYTSLADWYREAERLQRSIESARSA